MSLRDSDYLLAQRSGVQYKVKLEDLTSAIRSSDLVLVNRNNIDYKLTGSNFLDGNFNDSDWFLGNRSGTDYKILGVNIRPYIVTVPDITSVTLSYVGANYVFDNNSRFNPGNEFKLEFTLSAPWTFGVPYQVRGNWRANATNNKNWKGWKGAAQSTADSPWARMGGEYMYLTNVTQPPSIGPGDVAIAMAEIFWNSTNTAGTIKILMQQYIEGYQEGQGYNPGAVYTTEPRPGFNNWINADLWMEDFYLVSPSPDRLNTNKVSSNTLVSFDNWAPQE